MPRVRASLPALLVAAWGVRASAVECAASGVCGDADADADLSLLASPCEVNAAAAGGACGDPAWFYADCDDSQTQDTSYGTRRRKYTPPATSCPSKDSHPWCDLSKDSTSRAELLVSEMNFSELAAQVSCDIFGGVPAIERLGVNSYNYIRENNHGLVWNDICPITTMFPQVITMAAAFNRTLWQAIGEASAIEARYNYVTGKQNSLFTQANFNIFLDPRWGRGQEVPGEDPLLNTEYAKSWVEGGQAPKGPGGVPLTGVSCKHFAAYSFEGAGGWPFPAAESSRHNFDAAVTEQDLADTHLPMFEGCAAVGAMGMMTSYNAVNGVPMAANGKLTNDLARKAWGFSGTVVTDCGAVTDLHQNQKYVSNAADAAQAALEGGADIECGSTVKSSAPRTPKMEALLRTAVTHSFGVRFRVGEFDPPAADGRRAEKYDQAAHAQLAFDAAVQGAVLLKNEGGLLPLAPSVRLAVAGALKDANWQALGSYSSYMRSMNWTDSPNVVTPVEGLRNCGLGFKLTVVEGGPTVCSLTEQVIAGTNSVVQKPEADVVVVVAGMYCNDQQEQDVDARPGTSGKCQAGCLEAEGCDRQDLALPRGQRMLMDRAVSWGIPIVLVLMSGGPVDLSAYKETKGIKAILWMGYPGQAAGTALAQLLFGLESPTGRLTQTFYSGDYTDVISIKDMNVRPDETSGHPGRGYRFVDPKYVVYPFGFGLSYHTWNYAWAGGASEEGSGSFAGCTLRLSLSASGGGGVQARPATSVLLFLAPPNLFGPSAPKKSLRQFDRVLGASAEVSFVLGKKDFELADREGKLALYPGAWVATIGEPAALTKTLQVTGAGCRLAA